MATAVITHLGAGSDIDAVPQGPIYLNELGLTLTFGTSGNSPVTIQRSLQELDNMTSLAALRAAGKIKVSVTLNSVELNNVLPSVTNEISTVTELSVDPVAGDDNNIGDADNPLLTIQEAVFRLKPPSRGAPYWTEDRVIRVIHSAGMAPITEFLDIPPHTGPGILIIEAEEEVMATGLVQSGAIAAIGGFEAKKRITLTTAALTNGAHDHDAFVVLTNRETIEPREFQAGWEDLPVVTNGTNTIDVVCAEPGVFTAFHYGDGVSLKLVRPQITWTQIPFDAIDTYAPAVTSLLNRGGGLVIRGFKLQAPADIGNLNGRVFLRVAPSTDCATAVANNVQINRCKVIKPATGSQFWTSLSSGGADVAGLLVGDDAVEFLVVDSPPLGCNLYNIDVKGPGSTLVGIVAGQVPTDRVHLWGIVIDGMFLQVANGNVLADIRSGYYYNVGAPIGVLIALSVEGAGGTPALQCGGLTGGSAPSTVTIGDGSRIKGSSGNTSVGCQIGLHSNANVFTGTPTLSGSGGELKVGTATAASWASQAGGVTNATLFARYN